MTLPFIRMDVTRDGQSRAILQPFRAEIAEGAHIGAIGPNGAGKTTFLRALSGLDRSPHISVAIDGQNLSDMPRQQIARLIAFLPQSDEADGTFRVRDYISLARLAVPGWHEGLMQAAAATCGITDLLDRQLGALSGGEHQKIMLARCLAQQPRILLLDEPTNHLDVASRIKILHLLRDLPITVICVLHDLALVSEFASQLLLFDKGALIEKPRHDAVFQSDDFRTALGLSATEIDVMVGGGDMSSRRTHERLASRLPYSVPLPDDAGGGRGAVPISPHHLQLRRGYSHSAEATLCNLPRREYRGDGFRPASPE
ncbi:MAG: ABC transporter ATP-binding protein [Acetobacteraceae bacterium]